MQQLISLNPVEPARIGWRQARGAALSVDFVFLTPVRARAALDQSYPQLVFRPRSDTLQAAYDLTVTSAANGLAHLDVPGAFFSDPRGYGLELYFRNAEGQPQSMVAAGTVAMTGGAYQTVGPLFAATVPTGPAGATGPTGPAGQDGERGSKWFSSTGAPTIAAPVAQPGDQYLDTSTGDIWQFTGTSWARSG
jgi:hypothetical protein